MEEKNVEQTTLEEILEEERWGKWKAITLGLVGAGLVCIGYSMGYKHSTKQFNLGMDRVFAEHPEVKESFMDALFDTAKKKALGKLK